MARPIPEKEMIAIEDVVRRHPGGVVAQEIAEALTGGLLPRMSSFKS